MNPTIRNFALFGNDIMSVFFIVYRKSYSGLVIGRKNKNLFSWSLILWCIRMDVHSCHQVICITLQWRHNERNGSSNHRRLHCLLNRLFRHRSKKKSKLRVTGLWGGNSPVTGEFPAQKASNVKKVSIWWRHHELYHMNPVRSRKAYIRLSTVSSLV